MKINNIKSLGAFSISNSGGGGSYVLPTATANRLGGIKVGENLTVEADGTLNAQAGGAPQNTNPLEKITCEEDNVVYATITIDESEIELEAPYFDSLSEEPTAPLHFIGILPAEYADSGTTWEYEIVQYKANEAWYHLIGTDMVFCIERDAEIEDILMEDTIYPLEAMLPNFHKGSTGNKQLIQKDNSDGAIKWVTDNKLENTATGTNSLTILGTPATSDYGLNIGANTSVGINGSTAVGANARAGEYGTAVGGGNASNNSASATAYASTAIGSSAEAGGSYSTSIGKSSLARGQRSVCLGASANDHYHERCTLVGYNSQAEANYAIAIGAGTSANAVGAIQIGNTSSALLTNATAKTLQVYEWPLLDGNTGKIFSERLPSGNSVEVTDTMPTPSSSNVGQVKLYSGTTTSDFTNGYLYQCKLESTTSETVTFDSDKVVATPEMFWLVVKSVVPETYANVTNGYLTYNESDNLVTFTFKDANGNVLGELPADVGTLSSLGITFNNLVDGDVINFTCFSGTVESYKWVPLLVQESSEIKVYNAPSWSENTTLFPNRTLPLPNVDDLTDSGLYRVKFNYSMQSVDLNLDYLCQVSAISASGTVIGYFQTLQVFYPSLNGDKGINVTLYRLKQLGSTWPDWKSSLVTSVSNTSTDVEYVSAKLFYDTCGNIEALINAL
jgi:hypothetical protein